MMKKAEVAGGPAGRKCPYCLTSLQAGEATHVCAQCGAVHHADCWVEGGGCSVFGCQLTEPGEGDVTEASAIRSSPQSQLPGEDGSSGSSVDSQRDADDEFTVELRTSGGASPGKMRRRNVWLAVGGVALALGVAGGAFLLAGREGEPAESPPTKVRSEPQETKAEKKAEAERRADRSLTLKLEPIWVDDPGGKWSARLPQGEGWTKPESEGDVNDDSYNPLFRTLLWGPTGFVVVDTSPAEDPTGNPDNFTVAGQLLEPKDISSGEFPLGQMISYTNGEDECSGNPCVKVMLSDGLGGGLTVWVKSDSMKEAKTIARTFAQSAEREY